MDGHTFISRNPNMSIRIEAQSECVLVREIMEVIESVTAFVNFRKTHRKECLSLVRRLRLLVPLLEEIKEIDSSIPDDALKYLGNLNKALLSAKKLLKTCNYGSKIYLAFESEAVTSRFHAVYDKLSEALDRMPYDDLRISEEVKEQVQLMSMQLKRAKTRVDTLDIELAMDMMVVFSKTDDANAEIAIIERLAKKLELYSFADLEIETLAVSKLIKNRGAHNADSTQQIADLLGKFKQVAGLEENSTTDDHASAKSLQKSLSLLIPNEFLCPISLEIMTDPVIVATGQTYERESIQKWLDANHRTCPKTGQTLGHLLLAPNYALRNLILQWCENNSYKLPKKDKNPLPESSCSARIEDISSYVQKLLSSQPDVQSDAVLKIRMLSKENPDNRTLIANAGGIPPLIKLLSYQNSSVQQHAVTALLNLSLDEANKRLIAREGAIPSIIEVLHNGTDEARENSAAALFSLSMLNENKVMVGILNGIPPLIDLLRNGTSRGKKDAATALFNLCINQANKTRAIKAGIIPALLYLIDDKNLGMIDEALSILLLVATQPEANSAVAHVSLIEALVGIIREGTPKNKECSTAVLLELGSRNSGFILVALQYGVYDHLIEITRCGTSRAQRKAKSLLEHMSKCEQIP